MKKEQAVLVSVSALAISAAPFDMAKAQTINLNCPQNLYIGQLVACGTGNIEIRPNGGIVQNGCVGIISPPIRAQCQISITGAPPTKSLEVTFDPTPVLVTGATDTVTLDAFLMQKKGVGGGVTKLLYTTGELTVPVTINVGATVNFVSGQGKGLYSGNISINANFN